MSINNSRLTKGNADQKMADGTQRFLSHLVSLPVGSGTLTPAEIIQIFKDRIATNQAAQTAAAQRTAAVKADADKRAQTAVTVAAFRRMVQGMFSESPDTLAAFGLAPLKVATKSVETKAEAVAKSLATRAARHTMGSRQRAKITGTTASTGSSASPASPPVVAQGTTPAAAPIPAAGPVPAGGQGSTPVTAPVPTAGPVPAAAPAVAPVAPQTQGR